MNLNKNSMENVDLVSKKYLNKSPEEKAIIRQRILAYAKEQLNKNMLVTRRELQNLFHIRLYSYFNSLGEVYEKLEFDIINNPNLRRQKKEKELIKNKMIEYVKNCLINNKKPTVADIRKKFNSGIESYFGNITNLYKEAGIDLKNFYSFFYKEKEIQITPVIIDFLKDKDYAIKKVAINENRFGPDIVVEKEDISIPVEIKARHKNNMLLYPRDNPIKQIQRYVRELNSPFGILITTTDKISPYKDVMSSNIILYNGQDLLNHFKGKKEQLDIINWIRNSIGQDKKDFIKEKREKIIEFIQKEHSEGKLPSFKTIRDSLRINFYCYFDSVYQAYEESGVEYPLQRKKKFGRFSMEEKEKIRDDIINFVRQEYKNNRRLNRNRIENIFQVDIRTYFSSRKEIIEVAKNGL
ncbi:hypothetical protein HYY70_06585 [Candidatus Woesearchaeota archaeon]|nr:hypothetical protein [Candidatus Woesearchaeota archaeon]